MARSSASLAMALSLPLSPAIFAAVLYAFPDALPVMNSKSLYMPVIINITVIISKKYTTYTFSYLLYVIGFVSLSTLSVANIIIPAETATIICPVVVSVTILYQSLLSR